MHLLWVMKILFLHVNTVASNHNVSYYICMYEDLGWWKKFSNNFEQNSVFTYWSL